MKKRWRQWKSRLTYRTKIAGSLLVTLALLFSLWAYYGYPLPTAELEFRRLERQNLLPRSEIVFTAPRSINDLEPKNGPAFTLFDRWAVGTRGRRAAVGYLDGKWSQIDVFPLNDGPSPVPLPMGHVSWIERAESERGIDSIPHIWPALLFLEMPEAARGELVLDVTYWEKDYQYSFVAVAPADKAGTWETAYGCSSWSRRSPVIPSIGIRAEAIH